MKIRNVMGTKFSGTIGKDTVAVEGPTTDYLRAYAVPTDPKSERQLEQRDRHRQAVAAWRAMSLVQQAFYRHLDRPRIGYHVFLGRALTALVHGEPIETPVPMAWSPEGGARIEHARLLVRRHKTMLFEPSMAAPTVKVALTPSDAPYVLVLVKGFQEDEVLTLSRAAVSDPPPVLDSATLGIKLVPKAASDGTTPRIAPS
jgi:hypothetical protein